MELVATYPILYRSHQYEVGDSLPADDESMAQAWLDAGTAVWSEGKQEKAKATPATATAGLAGESKNPRECSRQSAKDTDPKERGEKEWLENHSKKS